MRLLHVSAPTCRPQGASLSSWVQHNTTQYSTTNRHTEHTSSRYRRPYIAALVFTYSQFNTVVDQTTSVVFKVKMISNVTYKPRLQRFISPTKANSGYVLSRQQRHSERISLLPHISDQIHRVIKKPLCTWWPQYRRLQVMFKVADRQAQGGTRLTLKPSVIRNSNYVIMVIETV
jgi:hypothetical protein